MFSTRKDEASSTNDDLLAWFSSYTRLAAVGVLAENLAWEPRPVGGPLARFIPLESESAPPLAGSISDFVLPRVS